MSNQDDEIGLIGLGVMGRNFALNLADHGFPVAVYNRNSAKIREFMDSEAGERPIAPAYTLKEFLGQLKRPRAVILLVSAGRAVDAVLDELRPLLETGDLIIDGGNSNFHDTDRRGQSLAGAGLLYMGMGVSGGEKGARFGPSLMPGGPREGYDRVRLLLEAAAAQVNNEPCVAYLGPGSAGHYVKMVHNGIEYGLEQLIAETYDLLKLGLGFNNDDLHTLFAQWNQEELQSYLVEITSQIFTRVDEKTGERLVDVILDVARQKGTGIWTCQEAMDARVPVPTIDLAVAVRCLSAMKAEREAASRVLPAPAIQVSQDRQGFAAKMKNALYAAMIVTYAQGLALLRQASTAYGYQLDLETVARIWRGGCIIRAALLEDVRAAYQHQPELLNLLLDPHLGREVSSRQGDWRQVLQSAVAWGIPTPGLMVSLAYWDGYRRARLPANLIQAQRDYFGAHTYERVDLPGTFHTEWD
ncbi:MAG: NADP-dependent phosphogluconate dehydrogenase [Thermodesulfobacteriota bacterium]